MNYIYFMQKVVVHRMPEHPSRCGTSTFSLTMVPNNHVSW